MCKAVDWNIGSGSCLLYTAYSTSFSLFNVTECSLYKHVIFCSLYFLRWKYVARNGSLKLKTPVKWKSWTTPHLTPWIHFTQHGYPGYILKVYPLLEILMVCCRLHRLLVKSDTFHLSCICCHLSSPIPLPPPFYSSSLLRPEPYLIAFVFWPCSHACTYPISPPTLPISFPLLAPSLPLLHYLLLFAFSSLSCPNCSRSAPSGCSCLPFFSPTLSYARPTPSSNSILYLPRICMITTLSNVPSHSGNLSS